MLEDEWRREHFFLTLLQGPKAQRQISSLPDSFEDSTPLADQLDPIIRDQSRTYQRYWQSRKYEIRDADDNRMHIRGNGVYVSRNTFPLSQWMPLE